MKKTTTCLLALSLLAAPAAMAGESYQTTTMTQQMPPPPALSLYNAGEFQVDLFGAYAWTSSGNRRLIHEDDTFGGGIALNYFFTRNIGLGLEGTLLDTDGDLLGTTNLNVVFRFPIADTGFAPYAFGGGGITFNADDIDSQDFRDARDRAEDDDNPRDGDDVIFIGHAGAGLEYRFSPHFSIFGDARYTWAERHDGDFGLARAGVKFVF